jgi:hypothetical protein
LHHPCTQAPNRPLSSHYRRAHTIVTSDQMPSLSHMQLSSTWFYSWHSGSSTHGLYLQHNSDPVCSQGPPSSLTRYNTPRPHSINRRIHHIPSPPRPFPFLSCASRSPIEDTRLFFLSFVKLVKMRKKKNHKSDATNEKQMERRRQEEKKREMQ